MSTPFLAELSRAIDVEATDLPLFASRVGNAIGIARTYERNPLKFVRYWERLYKFHVKVFDLDAAERVLNRATRLRLPGNKRISVQFQRMDKCIRPVRDLVSSASDNLATLVETGERKVAGNGVVLFVPFRLLSGANNRHFRHDLPKILGQARNALMKNGIEYTELPIYKSNTTPIIGSNLKYISHHTFSNSRNGLHFKITDRREFYSFDKCGFSGFSCFTDIGKQAVEAVDEAAALALLEEDRKTYIDGNQSKFLQPDATDEPLTGEPWIFVALQKVADITQTLAAMPMLDMLNEASATGRERGVRVIVKRHPGCRDERVATALQQGAERGDFEVSTASIHSLIRGSCAVCTVNSSVGAEALLHMKPVYVFGRSEYQYACHRIRSAGEFGRVFSPDKLPMDPGEIARFLYLLRRDYAFDINDAGFPEYLERKILDLVHTS